MWYAIGCTILFDDFRHIFPAVQFAPIIAAGNPKDVILIMPKFVDDTAGVKRRPEFALMESIPLGAGEDRNGDLLVRRAGG